MINTLHIHVYFLLSLAKEMALLVLVHLPTLAASVTQGNFTENLL